MNKNKTLCIFVLVFLVALQLVTAAKTYNVEIVEVSPTSLIPGEKSELTFEIENIGNVDLEDVVFSWEEKTGNILPIGYSNTRTIEGLDDGDSETINFDVFVSSSAEPGLYELTLTLRFEREVEKEIEKGNETTTETTVETVTKTSKAGIIVGGQTDFDVSVSDISSSGIILSVANIGKNPANSVTVIIPIQQNFIVSGSSSSIIGNLAKGDYSVASFQITSQSRSSSNLNVEIQYTDTMGARQTLTKTIEIQFPQQSSSINPSDSSQSITGLASRNTNNSNNNWFLIAFVLSGILTILLIILIIKRGKRKNEIN